MGKRKRGEGLHPLSALVPEQLQADLALIMVYVVSTFLSWKWELSQYSPNRTVGRINWPHLQRAKDSIWLSWYCASASIYFCCWC